MPSGNVSENALWRTSRGRIIAAPRKSGLGKLQTAPARRWLLPVESLRSRQRTETIPHYHCLQRGRCYGPARSRGAATFRALAVPARLVTASERGHGNGLRQTSDNGRLVRVSF